MLKRVDGGDPAPRRPFWARMLSGTRKDGIVRADRAGRLKTGGTVAETLLAAADDPDAVFYRMMRAVERSGEASVALPGPADTDVLIHARSVGARVHWQVMPMPVVEAPKDALADDAPLGVARLDADGTVSALNAWLRSRAGTPATLSDLLLDLPVENGRIHRLRADPGLMLRVLRADDADGVTLYLLPLGAEETAASTPDQFLLQLPIALARVDTDGKVIVANEAAQALLGGQLTQGRVLSELMEGLAQPVSARIRDVVATRRFARPEVARRKGGEIERFLQVSLSPMTIGGEFSILLVMSDATELKTLEAQFVQSQKMQAVGQLAGGVAHDFNNLLTALSGHCDLLLLRSGPGDRDYLDLMQIQQNANRAAALVGQLLAFSRKQTLQPKVIHLVDLLGDLSHLLNRLLGEKVRLSLDLAQDVPPVRADLRQIEQVIMNLVVNARDAMPDGGTVTVRARCETLAEEMHRDRATVAPGDWVVIEVTDTGCGIPERLLGSIFDPFFTTKRVGEGTGLGLSTAYGIVKQTGGFLFVDSVIDEGTTFFIYLPRHVARAEELTEVVKLGDEAPGQADLLGSGTVLLVEDEAPVRAFAARALQLRGYNVLEASSGEEALEMLAARPKVDVFISDVIMPGLDGPSWVREALRDYPDVEIIFVSGYAEDMFDDEHERPVNSTFLAKPFSLNDLSLQVKRSMDASRARRRAPS